ncbi:MAG: AAA family ATPase [Planctomycetaceae bacterium]|nr:AAA family ATPase [Planctomycetaceae bacterium]
MRSIAIMNQKGGVGKTTSTVNISAALAAAGKRVCVIDLDPQSHATLHLGEELPYGAKSVYDVLLGKCKLAEVRQQVAENLWLVPAHLDMVGAEMELASAVGRELILRDELADDRFPLDYLFIDCPPSLGLFTLNALTAVNEVFVPLLPHYLSLQGFMRLVETLEAVTRRLNKQLRLTGIWICQFEGTQLAKEIVADIESFFQHRDNLPSVCRSAVFFETKIRKNVRLAEAPSHGKPIFGYDPNSLGAEDYRNLAAEIAGFPQQTG